MSFNLTIGFSSRAVALGRKISTEITEMCAQQRNLFHFRALSSGPLSRRHATEKPQGRIVANSLTECIRAMVYRRTLIFLSRGDIT